MKTFKQYGDPPRLRFTLQDGERASGGWGANCGPGAIAAVLGLTLDEVRPHLGDFEAKRYTNPTLMLATLKSLGALFEVTQLGRSPRGGKVTFVGWPIFGLARIQWEGPWTRPEVPIRARYRFTHWVGVARRDVNDVGIFDINCMASGGWVRVEDWASVIVPYILENCVPRADGNWHITHAIEVAR